MKNPPINLINGQIITLDPALPTTNSIYINKGKIFSLGERIKNAKIIDLQGATVVPGFIDAHFHLANLGKSLQELQLTGISSVQSIIDAVVNKSKTFDKNNWILGRGWDQNIWGYSNFPASSLLDEAVKNHPVVLTRIDGHAIWINKVVRDLIGYNENDNPLLGGEVINNCIFIDNAMMPVHKILPVMLLLPITGVISAVLLLGEILNINIIVGGLIIIIGVGIILFEKKNINY